ncbi:MAG TPA: hypothetical protein VG711_02545, partial [Phycisphaerales bacterium]|nr:hypothetical protein [Phycisphaerales bacterium]
EQLTFNATIRSLVEQEASTDRIREAAVIEGMRLMWMDGLEKARVGLTTLSEIARAAAVLDLHDTGSGGETLTMRASA